jgi:hypothetical protein
MIRIENKMWIYSSRSHMEEDNSHHLYFLSKKPYESLQEIFQEVLDVPSEHIQEFYRRFALDFKPNIVKIVRTLRCKLSTRIRKAAHLKMGIWLNEKAYNNEKNLQCAKMNARKIASYEYNRKKDIDGNMWHLNIPFNAGQFFRVKFFVYNYVNLILISKYLMCSLF